MPAAAHRLHVVVLSSEELAEQTDRSGDTISFAADRGAKSPGYGRIAVVITDDHDGQPTISHLGLVRSGQARTNLDATWVLSAVREIGAIRLSNLAPELGRSNDTVLRAASLRRGGALPDAASEALRSAIQSRVGAGEWPSTDGTPQWMLPHISGTLQQDYTNALGTALMFSGMKLGSLRSAPALGESPLTELLVNPPEASLIDNDLRNFPGMDAEPQAEHIVRFTDGIHTLDVMNVNATAIEAAAGVDLVYYSHDYDCFVLVQYKRMETESGSRIASVDARLPRQLAKMVAFDAFGNAAASPTEPTAFRLAAGATFTKFAYPVVSPLRDTDLTKGMYIPSGLLKRLHDEGELIGPRGGAAVTHTNLKRWLSNEQFSDLVKEGWVGTSGVSMNDVKAYVQERLAESRVVVVAAHSSARRDPPDQVN